MKILALGDVLGSKGVEHIKTNLWRVRGELGVDFTVVNGENAADIYGMSASDAHTLIDSGADLITLGNHAFSKKDIFTLLSDSNNIIRPANYPPLAPGGGYTILNVGGWRILGINVMGTALMESLACPFATVDRILERERGAYDFALMDIHAESTSEKIALARYFDGRVAIMFGTHTHVPTADEQILPAGSGYITDIGMSGPIDGVIGADARCVIDRFRTKIGARLTVADGRIEAQGALFDYDTSAGRVRSVKRIKF